jgi:hypothetical protein
MRTRQNKYLLMSKFKLSAMSREDLTDLLAEVMFQLRKFDAEDIKDDFINKSQRLRMGLELNEPEKKISPPGAS